MPVRGRGGRPPWPSAVALAAAPWVAFTRRRPNSAAAPAATSSAASMPIATSITARRATPSISAAGTLTVTIQPDIGERVKAW